MAKSGERSSMVEYQLPKLVTGVRFPSLAPFKSCNTQGIEDHERRAVSKIMNILIIGIILLILQGCATKTHTTYEQQNISTHTHSSMIIRSSDIDSSTPVFRKPASPKYSQATTKKVNYSPRRNSQFMWPVKGEIASYFGLKVDKSVNKGIDIRASEGTDVFASRAGKVVYCDSRLKGFGNTVIIDHMDGFQTVYSYNSFIAVKVGDLVEQNDIIARVGSSGRACGNMLHFEIRKNGAPQNPELYLSRLR